MGTPAITKAYAELEATREMLAALRRDVGSLMEYATSGKFAGAGNDYMACSDLLLRCREILDADTDREFAPDTAFAGLACHINRAEHNFAGTFVAAAEYPAQSLTCRECGQRLSWWFQIRRGTCGRHYERIVSNG